ncbi:hypothetical protein QTI17_16955 [Variovorax sp. J31P179]|jgi:hypothetical protein|uniref:hypothetical protein n=1 Tax=Variovorax sp. J31P179 TaxID=3053508 RepID=UPI002578F280|nr:hypothetical protein [Variovorax sp. J31P179]MDM0082284.1 hypothetical protein [Variovorax sp. J31P179]
MADFRPVALPLFDADAPASEAFDNPGLRRFAGVVSIAPDGYRLHRAADLMGLAGRPGGLPLMRAGGLLARELTPEMAANAGLDPFAPELHGVANLCRSLHVDALVTQQTQGADGQAIVMAYVDAKYDMRLVGSKYRCAVGGESYDERDYKTYGGQCPFHKAPLR